MTTPSLGTPSQLSSTTNALILSLKIRDHSSLPSPNIARDSVNKKNIAPVQICTGSLINQNTFSKFCHTTCMFTASIVEWTFFDIYYVISQHDYKTISFINIRVFLSPCNIYPWWQEQINGPLVCMQWDNFKKLFI